MTAEAHRAKQRIDALLDAVTEGTAGDLELQAHWARYICILVSGLLELSARSLLSEYAKSKAEVRVANYVTRQLAGFQNPNMERLLQVLGAFHPSWREALLAHLDDEAKLAVDSIVSNRNQIAHGNDVGITIVTVKRFYEQTLRVVRRMDELVTP